MITPFQSSELEKHSLVFLNDLSNTQRPLHSAPAPLGTRSTRHPLDSARKLGSKQPRR
jgi:hypothetical protein